jgi:ubiquinone/menaquinone biosynthesis C-methylase UbiE
MQCIGSCLCVAGYVSMDFNKIAPCYSLLESLLFGGALQATRTSSIHNLVDAENILIIGEGRGRLLNELLRLNPKAEVCVVEQSARMIEKMKCDLEQFDLKKVTFINESFLTYPGTYQFDAVCTCFFFDCFESREVKNGIGKIYSLLKVDGIWMNVDFRFFQNNVIHQRIAHRILIQFLYGFFHLTTGLTTTTLVCVETLACKFGFKVVETFEHAFLPLSSEVYRRY